MAIVSHSVGGCSSIVLLRRIGSSLHRTLLFSRSFGGCGVPWRSIYRTNREAVVASVHRERDGDRDRERERERHRPGYGGRRWHSGVLLCTSKLSVIRSCMHTQSSRPCTVAVADRPRRQSFIDIIASVVFVTKIKTRTRIIGRRFQRTRTRIIVIQKTKTK